MESVINLGIITDTFKFNPTSKLQQVRTLTMVSSLSYFNGRMFLLTSYMFILTFYLFKITSGLGEEQKQISFENTSP